MKNIGRSPYSEGYIVKFQDGSVSLDRTPKTQLSNTPRIHTVLEGETIQSIAFQYYGDSGYWADIADINNIFNPFTDLEDGMEIIIP